MEKQPGYRAWLALKALGSSVGGETHEHRLRVVVGEEQLASRIGSGDVPVLGTPSLVLLMERAAFELSKRFTREGKTSVGTSIDVRHVAPVAPGEELVVTARLLVFDGRRMIFWLEARSGDRLVGYGVHERVVVDREEFIKKAGMR